MTKQQRNGMYTWVRSQTFHLANCERDGNTAEVARINEAQMVVLDYLELTDPEAAASLIVEWASCLTTFR